MGGRSTLLNRIARHVADGHSVPAVAQTVGHPERTVSQALDELVAAGLLRREGSDYELAVEPIRRDRLGSDPLYHRYVIDSTNRWAARHLAQSEQRAAFLAEVQTAGRGRHDREWASPGGGLWWTLTRKPRGDTEQLPRYTLAMAVALTKTLTTYDVAAEIKWPNDVLVGTKKLAGILTEYTRPWLRIGVGVNVAVPPRQLPPEGTSLQALDVTVDRGALAATVVSTFDELLETPAQILPQWRAHAATIGQRVRIETDTSTITGTAVDVEASGALTVETETETVTVTAGDCIHLRDD